MMKKEFFNYMRTQGGGMVPMRPTLTNAAPSNVKTTPKTANKTSKNKKGA